MKSFRRLLLRFSRSYREKATRDFVLKPDVGFGVVDVLPFSNRQNFYDVDIQRSIQDFMPSKGSDARILNAKIQESLGRPR